MFSPEGGQVLEEALERAGIGVGQPRLAELCSLGSGRVAMGSSYCVCPSPTQEQLQPRQIREGWGQRGPGVTFGEGQRPPGAS